MAIYDLIERTCSRRSGHDGGPYVLQLSINDNRLVFDIRTEDGDAGRRASVVADAVAPDRQGLLHGLRQLLPAIRTATPDKIEAIDMGRRGIHNDGSNILMERLKGKIAVDFDTARRLFTLICVLHWKG